MCRECDKYYTFSSGQTPAEILLQQLKKYCPDGSYEMSLVGDDQEVAIEAINVGIDSHLEAVTFNDNPKYNQEVFEVEGKSYGGPVRLELDTTLEGIVVICRRLYDFWCNCDCSEEDAEDCKHWRAYDLRSCILQTLNIEEV